MRNRVQNNNDGSLQIIAHAKVNLGLSIVGKRSNGYHELESLVVFSDFGDKLVYEPSENFQLTVTGSFEGMVGVLPEANIVYQACELLSQKYGVIPLGHIKLTKNLPVGAGIGGGSADAAATLLLLSKAWNLAEEDLSDIAISLGADVPACFTTKPKYISGIGERIEEINFPKIHLILVNPLIKLETVHVFGLGFKGFSDAMPRYSGKDPLMYIKDLNNDLLDNAVSLAPEIKQIIDNLNLIPNSASGMSGSGSTCFCAFLEENMATEYAEKLSKIYNNFWVKKVTTLVYNS